MTTRATKTTIARLKARAERYMGCPLRPGIMHYYGDHVSGILLTYIMRAQEAEQDLKECGQCAEAVKEWAQAYGLNPEGRRGDGRAVYTDDGLYFRAWGEDHANHFRGLAYRYPALVRYTNTHGLNSGCITDVNTLAKLLLAAEAAEQAS